MLFDEGSELSDLLILVQVEVESQRSTLSELGQVVIKTLLGDPNLLGGFLKAHSLENMVLVHVSVVQLSPLRYFLYYVPNRPLFGSLAIFVC